MAGIILHHAGSAHYPLTSCRTLRTQAGDHVIYSKYAGTDIAVGDDAHVLLKVGMSVANGHVFASHQY